MIKYELRSEESIRDRLQKVEEELSWKLAEYVAAADSRLDEFALESGYTGYVYTAEIDEHVFTGVIDFNMSLSDMVSSIWEDIQNGPIVW